MGRWVGGWVGGWVGEETDLDHVDQGEFLGYGKRR